MYGSESTAFSPPRIPASAHHAVAPAQGPARRCAAKTRDDRAAGSGHRTDPGPDALAEKFDGDSVTETRRNASRFPENTPSENTPSENTPSENTPSENAERFLCRNQ